MEGKRDLLHLYGTLDVLIYYSKISKELGKFLRSKKIATKIHLPRFFFLKRGSKEPPLYIQDMWCVDERMLKLRGKYLKEVKQELSEKQRLVWDYFPPRKLIDFFYATNDEGRGKAIERVFIDIDRKKHSADEARKVAFALIDEIKKDKEFNRKLKYRIVVLWTGNSFHVYLLLKKKINLEFYNKHLSYGEKRQDSFIMKWAFEISQKTKIPVSAGHEKSKKFIILDSSNTPSGKLARAPFSLHISNNKIDGVCIPVSLNELKDKALIARLDALTPEKVLKNLNAYSKLL